MIHVKGKYYNGEDYARSFYDIGDAIDTFRAILNASNAKLAISDRPENYVDPESLGWSESYED